MDRADFFITVMAVLFLALLTGVTIYIGVSMDAYRCRQTARAMSVEYQYSFSTGCMVKVDGKLFPLRLLRAT